MNPHSRPQPNEEERLMALLALDVQELPPGSSPELAKPRSAGDAPIGDLNRLNLDLDRLEGRPLSGEQVKRLHAYLDAHPEAFEALLRRRRSERLRPESATRSWRDWFSSWQFSVPRYAAAFGVAAVCAVLVTLVTMNGRAALSEDVELAYADLIERTDAPSLAAAAAGPQGEARLGFSVQARPTDDASLGFALGLETGRHRLQQSKDSAESSRIADRTMYVLGQWNALLLSASQLPEPLAPQFWQSQHDRFGTLAEALTRENVDPVVIAHARRVEGLLGQLAVHSGARTTHELSQELLLFRARFSP